MSEHIPGCIFHGRGLQDATRTSACLCGRLERALEECRHLARELVEVLEERNRARDIAVALEQEIAACPVIEHRPIRG